MADYIRQAAIARGIDPDVALKVARSEGLARNTWQSNLTRGGHREPSYGPFQLLKGGPGTGYRTGMGNDFQTATGLDPADPANWQQGVDFALNQAAKSGWTPWYGAKAAGVENMEGVGGARALRTADQLTRPTTPADVGGMPGGTMPAGSPAGIVPGASVPAATAPGPGAPGAVPPAAVAGKPFSFQMPDMASYYRQGASAPFQGIIATPQPPPLDPSGGSRQAKLIEQLLAQLKGGQA